MLTGSVVFWNSRLKIPLDKLGYIYLSSFKWHDLKMKSFYKYSDTLILFLYENRTFGSWTHCTNVKEINNNCTESILFNFLQL